MTISFIFIIIVWVILFKATKKSNKSGAEKKNSGTQRNTDYEVQRTYANNTAKTAKPTPNSSSGSSTTEMLRQKALADEREHRLERQKQKMENKQHYGNLNYAGRYLLGDSVPPSRKIVICDYCNAENLVPKNDNSGKYNCYFCREKL